MRQWLTLSFTLALGFGALAAISVTPSGKRGVFMGSVQLRVQSCPKSSMLPWCLVSGCVHFGFHWEPPDLTSASPGDFVATATRQGGWRVMN